MKGRLIGATRGHALLQKNSEALTVQFHQILKQIVLAKESMGEIMRAFSFALTEGKYAAGDNIKHIVLENVGTASLHVRSRQENVAGGGSILTEALGLKYDPVWIPNITIVMWINCCFINDGVKLPKFEHFTVPPLVPSSVSRIFFSSNPSTIDGAQVPAAIDYSTILSEDEYHKLADETLHDLQEKFEEYGDEIQIDGFDIDYGNHVLTLKLGILGTYIINKQTPNRQIWLSSPVREVVEMGNYSMLGTNSSPENKNHSMGLLGLTGTGQVKLGFTGEVRQICCNYWKKRLGSSVTDPSLFPDLFPVTMFESSASHSDENRLVTLW